MNLELDDRQADVLADVLSHYLSELRMEIVGTDRKIMRDDMKGKEVIIKDLLVALNTPRNPS